MKLLWNLKKKFKTLLKNLPHKNYVFGWTLYESYFEKYNQSAWYFTQIEKIVFFRFKKKLIFNSFRRSQKFKFCSFFSFGWKLCIKSLLYTSNYALQIPVSHFKLQKSWIIKLHFTLRCSQRIFLWLFHPLNENFCSLFFTTAKVSRV